MMKNILLLGDSIRLGYQEEVTKALEGAFDVWGPADNCRFAKFTLCTLNAWMAEYGKKPDIVHWNNGLWDTCVRYAEDGSFTSLEEYERDMLCVLRELKKLSDCVIFATTTPVNPAHANQNNKTIDRYNAHIVEVLKKEGAIINDLNSLVRPHIDAYICEDFIHLSDEGKKACAAAIADLVKAL